MNSKTILIVDDDPHLILGLAVRLRANGYEVISASDAVSAITIARKALPGLIVLDIGLPGGDGFQVLERMRALADLVSIPVIVLSARDPTDHKKRALEAGAAAYFQKPPENYEFLNAIRHALGETNALSTFLNT